MKSIADKYKFILGKDIMRVLILSISKRSGHQHAAQAIENAFRQNYPSIKTINRNFFDIISNPRMEEMVSNTYLRILRTTPNLWDYLYDNEKVFKKTSRWRQLISRQTSIKFKEVIDQIRPSVIVCTQAFPGEVTATLKKNGEIDIPLVAIVTDFVAHAYWVHPEVDLYVVPAEKTKEGLVKHNILSSRIKILGIPIESVFEKYYSQLEKEEIIQKQGLKRNIPILLMMGGCQGFAPMKRLVQLIERSKIRCQILAVTGLHTKLRRELNKLKSELTIPLKVYGYTNNIHELMSISDLLITKPGGMTTTEALVKRLPMIISHPLPGQEEKNSQFLVESGAAIRINSEEEIISTINQLLSNRNFILQLQYNMDELVIHHSTQRIVNEIVHLLTDTGEREFAYA